MQLVCWLQVEHGSQCVGACALDTWGTITSDGELDLGNWYDVGDELETDYIFKYLMSNKHNFIQDNFHCVNIFK